ncbi:MAG: histidine phosphatase family protein [Spirochaetales bacterium]|nr:histidine phosphatase family protein [Spirochaetales bacterium]
MKDLLLLRHGEHDKKGYIGGGSDVPLSSSGKKEAEQLVSALRDFKPDFIFTSPMLRCLQSIEPFLKMEETPKPIICEDLKELNFGEWEGKTYDEINKTDKERLTLWYSAPESYKPPEGESLAQLNKRIEVFMKNIVCNGKDGRYLIVSHGGPIRCILSQLSKTGIEGHWLFQIDKGSFCRINIFDDQEVLIKGINIKGAEHGFN